MTLPAPNIGIEQYFFQAADVLSHIKSSRSTVILPQRTGPIADVLYSAAGNSADDMYYRKGIIGYSFEAGAQRITVNPTTGDHAHDVGFQPCFAGRHRRRHGLLQRQPRQRGPRRGDGVRRGQPRPDQGALHYARTPRRRRRIQYSSAQTSGDPINYKFDWVGEGAIIFYTTDGTTPIVPDDPPRRSWER